MHLPIPLPDIGASDVTVSVWFASVGDQVYAGDRLIELLAGSATFDVSAPDNGRLTQILALPGDIVTVGQHLGAIETEEPTP